MAAKEKASPREKLTEYRRKRDFAKTAEPAGGGAADRPHHDALRFIIQKHAASHLHFDFRLEMGGVMKSWAVPKGPSLDPAVKRLAVQVEDHPIAYNTFEGTIPAGEYGGGTVMLWDRGTYGPAEPGAGGPEAELQRQLAKGHLDIVLHGERLRGEFTLIRTRAGEDDGSKPQWLLFKRTDDYADPERDIVAQVDTSVDTGRTMDEIAGGTRVWHSNRTPPKAKSAAASVAEAAKKAAGKAKPGAPKASRKAAREAPDASKESASVVEARSRAADAGAALEPMYASIGTRVPAGAGWAFEPKYDGIRVLAYATPGEARLVTRNGKDKTKPFPEVVRALRALAEKLGHALVLDGEIVALDDAGKPARFQALQGRMHRTGAREIARLAESHPSALLAFDILLDDGDVLLNEPWSARRKRLEAVLKGRRVKHLRLGESWKGGGEKRLEQARDLGWEGVIAKRTDSTYRPGVRSDAWLKLKVESRQEFVVGGWTEPRNTRQHLGALLVGYFQGDRLLYAGKVGGGFDTKGLKTMRDLLRPLESETSPFAEKVRTDGPAHWVRPEVVVEVRFTEWTADGKLRQPIYLGTRDDKPAREVTREPHSVQATSGGGRVVAKRTKAMAADTSTGPDDPGEPVDQGSRSKSKATPKPAKKAAVKKAVERANDGGSADRAAEQAPRPAKKAVHPTGLPSAETVVPGAPVEVVERLSAIEAEGGDGTLSLGRGKALKVSSLQKVLFPRDGITKGDLMRHYALVSPYLLPLMKDRPLSLKRSPDGIDRFTFFQQKAPDDPPPAVRVGEVETATGEEARRLVGGDLATLLYCAQLASISVDPWHSRIQHPQFADYSVIDLDPGDGAPFSRVVNIALLVKEELDALGLSAAAKTSGKRGLHIYIPLAAKTPAGAAALVAQLVAARVAERHPEIATVERSIKARPAGTIYVDFGQNDVGKTVAAAYAVRPIDGARVSTPLRWTELTPALEPAAFTILTLPARLAEVGDLWGPAMQERNSLKKVLRDAGA